MALATLKNYNLELYEDVTSAGIGQGGMGEREWIDFYAASITHTVARHLFYAMKNTTIADLHADTQHYFQLKPVRAVEFGVEQLAEAAKR